MRRLTLAAVVLLAATACTDQDFVTDVPLRVVSASPTGMSVDAAREAKVVITFSEKLAPDSIGGVTLESLGYPDAPTEPQSLAFAAEYSDDPVPTLTLIPAQKLPFSTVFKVTVPTSVERARDGGPLPVQVGWSFRSVHPPALRVEKIEPADGSSGVARDAVVRVHFSEPVACASLEGGNAVLAESFDPHPHTFEGEPSRAISGSWNCPSVDAAAGATLDGTQCEADPSLCVVSFVPADPAFLFKYSSDLKLVLEGGSHADAPVASARATPYGGQLPATVQAAWHVVDPAPLALVASLPGNGARGVARDSSLLLSFSEPLDCSTLSETIVTLSQRFDGHPRLGEQAAAEQPVPGTWSCTDVPAEQRLPETCAASPELCQALFTPEEGFLYEWSSDVTVSLGGGLYAAGIAPEELTSVESARATTRGGQLPASLSVSFHVVDPPPLALVAASPSDGSTGVERSPSLRVTFSEPPDCATLSDALVVSAVATLDPHPRLAGLTQSHALAGSWSCPAPSAAAPFDCAPGAEDPCSATFTVDAAELPLEASTEIALTLSGGDYADGQALAGDRLFVESLRATTFGGQLPAFAFVDFRIEDPAAQLVVSTLPGNGAIDVAVAAAPIEIELAQPLACNTVNAGTVTSTVQLSDGSAGSYDFTLGCAEGGKRITLTPADASVPFPYSAVFTVSLAGGAFGQDLPAAWPSDAVESDDATSRGGQLASDFSFSFTTENPPAMLVKSSSPSGDGVGVDPLGPVVIAFSEALDCDSVTASTFALTETFAAPEDPSKATPAPASVACTFECPAGGDAAAVRCDHAAFAASSTIQVALSGGNGPADSIRSADATLGGGWLEAPATVFSFRAQDPAPLALSSSSPNGEPGANVSALSDVKFTFTRAIRCATAAPLFELFDENASAPVAGTFACTDGTSVGPDVDGATLIFTPSAPLIVDHYYRATARAGIAAADATVVEGTVHGRLEQDAVVRFSVAYENLQIVATLPAGTSRLTPIGANVAIQFNQDVAASSLVPCTPSVQAACNFWINEGTVSDKAGAIDLSFVSYDNSTYTVVFDPSDPANAPHLKADALYTATLLSGTAGVVSSNGVSRLPVDYTFSFQTSTNALIVAVAPAIDEMDVEAWAPICVEFSDDVQVGSLTAGGSNQITLAYEDAFGRTAQVPLDEATPYSISGRNGLTGNYVCLNVTDAPIPCLAGMRRLLYASLYSATVSTQVQLASGARLLSAFSWDFMTRNPPEISEVRIKNLVIDEPLAKSAVEVPVNSVVAIRFAEAMDATSISEANIKLVAEGASTPVAVSVIPDDPANPRAALVSLSSNLDYLDAGADKGRYALVLIGGAGGLTTAAGNYLERDLRVRFQTSPATHLAISPPEAQITPMVYIPVNSLDRALHLPSLNAESVYGTYGGARMGGLIAQHPGQLRSVTYIANPTYKPNTATPYQFHTTEAVLDYRGNPVPAVSSIAHTSGNTPSSTAIDPIRAANAGDVVPSAPGATLDGRQRFILTLPLQRGLRDRFIGTTYNAAAPDEPAGTISLEALGGADCPVAGTYLPLTVRHVPGATTATPDRVEMEVAGPPFMKSGCQYSLKIRQYATANIYDVGATLTACNGVTGTVPTSIISSATCAIGEEPPGLVFTGEAVAPTLVSLQVQLLDGSWVAASGASGVFGGTAIRATFSEPVDPASVSAASFSLSGGATGSYKVEGAVVTFAPDAGLTAGGNYTLTLGSVADLAGNLFAGTSASFDIESVVPTFDALAFAPAATREAPFGEVALDFSEAIDPASLTVNAALQLGSVSASAAGASLFGCATVDPVNPKRVLWRPSEPLAAGVEVTVTVNLAAATQQLTDLAGSAVAETARSFTP